MPHKDLEKRKAYQKAYRERNKQYFKDYNKAYHASRDLDEVREYRLQYKYGISLEEWNEKYLNQNKACAICETVTENLTVDHDHNTEKIRGLLCHHCNTALGGFKENKQILLRACDYLTKWE